MLRITVPQEVKLGRGSPTQVGDPDSRSSGQKKVVICGSMKDYDLMAKIGELLRSAGFRVVAPAPDEPSAEATEDTIIQRKRDASKRHMDHIRHHDTSAVLVVNVDRPGVEDYVGPNAFAEIGVAFSDGLPVFLLKGIPAAYADELVAWGVRCLNGEIQPLLDELAAPRPIKSSDWAEIQAAQV